MALQITAKDAALMFRHWLGCPVDGYLGSGYGSDVKALVQTPMAAGLADGVLAKAKQDLPLLSLLPADSINVYAQDLGMDKKGIFFEVGGELVTAGDGTDVLPQDGAPSVSLEPTLLDTLTEAGAALLDMNINVTLPSQDYF